MESCPRMVERSEGPASVLAIGTSVPPNVMYQKDYPDFYFRVTNSNHQTELKQKFERMCEKSCITKRHLYLTEELLRRNPSVCAYWEKSLDVRQDMVVVEVPKLAAAAAAAAMEEWGQSRSRITHLLFCTTAGVDMPGADWALLKLLGLRASVQRLMLYQQGCYGGGTVLRVAKDLAENNRGARVLVVCSEITAMTFRGPSDTHLDSLVGQALFGDGAAALVVGCQPHAPSGERACFEIHRAATHVLPDSDGAIDGHLREVGLTFHLLKDVPAIIGKNIAAIVRDLLLDQDLDHLDHDHDHLDHDLYNDMFWIVHPGGPAILDQVQDKLRLRKQKLGASRHVLDQFGNMSSACVHFIMDHMRRSSSARRLPTCGDGHRWGLLLAFGPGLTCEALLLRALPPPSFPPPPLPDSSLTPTPT